jgi:hypothetical protein
MIQNLILPIKPHVNQHGIINSPYRFNVYPAGRRFGKTEGEKIRAIYKVMRGRAVWWLNPTFDNTYEAWLDFLAFFEQFTPRDQINKSRRQIFAPTGGSIRMLGADTFKRGSGVDDIFVDEAAFMDLEELWQYQLRPMLLDNPKSGADFFSSTNGRNFFWQLWQWALDPNQPDWNGKHFTSYDNPLLDVNEIEDIRRNTPERVFLQEYMAEFLDDGGAVFRNLKACIYAELKPSVNPQVVIGVDWARHNDYTVLTVIDRRTRQVLEIDRFNQIDWTLQRGRLLSLCKKYRNPVIWAEANSIGEPNIEELRKSGLIVNAFQTTSASKQQIINQLALGFEQSAIGIPDNAVLLGELQAYSMEKLPSGTFRYTAPSGLHDDMVISLALAWHGISQSALITVSPIQGGLYKRRNPNLERHR